MLKNHCNLEYDRALGYVMLYTKINKTWSNIHQKTTLKSMLQFWSILEPTWLYFGKVWGAKLEPKWYQIALKIDPNIDQKKWSPFGSSQNRSSDFGPQLGGSRGVQWESVVRLFGLLKLSWSQEDPKSPPRSPRTSKMEPSSAQHRASKGTHVENSDNSKTTEKPVRF